VQPFLTGSEILLMILFYFVRSEMQDH